MLLDLSAVFATIDHQSLLHHLDTFVRITGISVEGIASYLTDTYQQVKLEDPCLPKVWLQFGVPRGSVIGPPLFILYSTPLSIIFKGHQIDNHLYADDSHL